MIVGHDTRDAVVVCRQLIRKLARFVEGFVGAIRAFTLPCRESVLAVLILSARSNLATRERT